MKKTHHRKARPSGKRIADARQLIFKTPGALTTKYSVVIETSSQRNFFHLADVHSPAVALWLSLVEYFRTSHSQTAITQIMVIGYSQTKEEREHGIAHAYLHLPTRPASE